MRPSRSLAVIGAGWAGLAAAVRATEAGARVTVFEMAPQPGGRARSLEQDGWMLDNGQHILIGAYRETLALMRTVGADPDGLLERRPLALTDPQGRGLKLTAGSAMPAFVGAVWRLRDWPLRERVTLLMHAMRWRLGGFHTDAQRTVADLVKALPLRARTTLIEPLCVAALNTPSSKASAQVFLRVLRDALFGGPGAADMLLPREPLSALLPVPATRWLQQQGTVLRWTSRVHNIHRNEGGRWIVDGEPFDSALLACSAQEAARIARPIDAAWADKAAAIQHEPIITLYLHSAGSRLPAPLVALPSGPDAPAQFAFDLGALDRGRTRDGLFAFVISGASQWVAAGLDATAQATLRQSIEAFASGTWQQPPRVVRSLAERRATFLCSPGLLRPPCNVAPGLAAAGDYVEGPYPATLEGAVRSALEALKSLDSSAA